MRNGKPTVPQAPTGVASVDIDTGVEGETEFTFDGSDSTDPQDSSLTYAWDFKDGTTISGQGATVTHVFDTPDTYNVELSVTNGFEETDTTTVSVIVESGQDVISSDTVLEAGTHDYPNGLLIESGVTVTVNGDTTADANGDYGGVKIVGDGPITIDGTIDGQNAGYGNGNGPGGSDGSDVIGVYGADGPNPAYGSASEAKRLGSGGDNAGGGGSVWLKSRNDKVTVNGQVNVNGQDIDDVYFGDFGSGGSIRIEGQTVDGTGDLLARGGIDTSGTAHTPGTGGRIAIYGSDEYSYNIDLSGESSGTLYED